MTYYPTLAEDVQRAREIIERGRGDHEASRFARAADILNRIEGASMDAGTIYGADTYAAWQLLRTFVDVCEAIGVDVIQTAMRARARSESQCECRTCGHSAGAHVGGSCLVCGKADCWK